MGPRSISKTQPHLRRCPWAGEKALLFSTCRSTVSIRAADRSRATWTKSPCIAGERKTARDDLVCRRGKTRLDADSVSLFIGAGYLRYGASEITRRDCSWPHDPDQAGIQRRWSGLERAKPSVTPS